MTAPVSPSIQPAPLRAPLLALLIGLAAILGAWGFQIIGGYVPCKLCLQERLFYYAGLPLLLLAILLRRWMPRAARLLSLLAGLVFLAGVGLGGYHAGAEYDFWLGPSDCGGGVAPVTDAADLLSQMKNTRLVSCSEASVDLFGLSFAGWNVVASLAVALLALRGAFASEKAVL
ncbi:disulfide bond formation protein B [Chthonobacter albigriseus]|uniref:disulfide bond formation protein B n=1 Tax=Chthonobacter albigriseus TaxID=1683161 RepID=UPI0015EF2431|nr:disulfide bond formation protein B [Chthonobacter albigriseus]